MRIAISSALAWLALAACAPPTEVLVVVATDFSVPDELDAIEVVVDGADGTTPVADRDAALARATSLPVTLRLVPQGAFHDGQRAVLTVIGYHAGTPVVRRRASVALQRGQALQTLVFLARRCGGNVTCAAPDQTCGEDGCVALDAVAPARVLPLACAGGLRDCDGLANMGCETDVLATDAANCGACGRACAAGVACEGGACHDRRVVEVAAGAQHACALTASGDVWCWGADDVGQSSGVPTAGAIVAPTRVAGVAGAVHVAAGGEQSCALDAAGHVACWGCGAWTTPAGIEATACRTARAAPAQLAFPSGFTPTEITLGAWFGCALGPPGDRRAFCWGANPHGELGTTPHADGPFAPQLLPAGAMLQHVSAAPDRALVVTASGLVLCFGAGGNSKCDSGDAAAPQQAHMPDGSGPFGAIAGGANHSCVVGAGGAAYCWGADVHAQLGTNVAQGSDVPSASAQATRSGPADAMGQLAAGGQHTCALLQGADGEVVCWGDNAAGECGAPATAGGGDAPDTVGTPTRVPGLRGAVFVAAGTRIIAPAAGGATPSASGHTCVVQAPGAIVCWGDDAFGQVSGRGGAGSSSQGPTLVVLGGGT